MTTNAGKEVVKSKRLRIAVCSVYLHSHFGKQSGGSTKKLEIELPYVSTIPLMAIYSRNLTFYDRHWHKNVILIKIEYYSTVKKNELIKLADK